MVTYRSPEEDDDETIDLGEVWRAIKKHYVALCLLTIIGGLVAGIGTKVLVRPTYESSASIFLTPMVSDAGYVDVNSINSNEKLVNNVMTLLVQNNILSQVAQETGVDSTDQLRKYITVSNTPNTTLVTISVVTEDAKLSKNIANATTTTFIDQMKDTLNVSNIEIVDKPRLSYVPVGPHVTRNALIGAVVGLGLGILYVILSVMLDKRLKNKEEAENYLGIPVLCELPNFDD